MQWDVTGRALTEVTSLQVVICYLPTNPNHPSSLDNPRHGQDWDSWSHHSAESSRGDKKILLCSNLILVWQDFLCSGQKWMTLPEQND